MPRPLIHTPPGLLINILKQGLTKCAARFWLGGGSRPDPLAGITNKHLLPPVDREPMIWHPVRQLIGGGITARLVVTSTHHMGSVVNSLGSVKRFGCEFTYRVQDEAGGIAPALALAREFAADGNPVAPLGNNIFEYSIAPHVDGLWRQSRGALVLLKQVGHPERFGIAALDKNQIVGISEKPTEPKSGDAVAGCPIYAPQLFDLANGIEPSVRGELQITAVNNPYVQCGKLDYGFVEGAGQTQAPLNPWKRQVTFYSATKTRSSARPVSQ